MPRTYLSSTNNAHVSGRGVSLHARAEVSLKCMAWSGGLESDLVRRRLDIYVYVVLTTRLQISIAVNLKSCLLTVVFCDGILLLLGFLSGKLHDIFSDFLRRGVFFSIKYVWAVDVC